MAAPKRNRHQILQDRVLVAELYMKGWEQSRIAAHMTENAGIVYSVEMVKRDLKMVRDGWFDSALRNFDELRAEQLAKLEMEEREAWEQWEASCGTHEKRTHGMTATGSVDYTVTEERCGDPRYLNTILAIIDRRCKLLGLDAPQKFAPTDPSGEKPFTPMTEVEADKRIRELMVKLGYLPDTEDNEAA